MTDQLAYRPTEAARIIGVSRSVFYARVLPNLKTVELGGLTLVPRKSLERWLDARVQ